MKLITFLIFLILSIASFAQPNMDELNEWINDGNCFLSLMDSNSKNELIKYYELAPMEWEIQHDTFIVKSAYPFKTTDEDFRDSIIVVEYQSTGLKTITRRFDKKCKEFFGVEDGEFWMVCTIQLPLRNQTLAIKVLKEEVWKRPNKDYSSTTKQEIQVIERKVQKDLPIRLVEVEKPSTEKLPYHIIPLKGGKWTKWRYFDGHCYRDTRMEQRVTLIQKALNKKGYDCKVTGTIDDATKAALLRFQKDNNLPTGRLDLETLKLLGVYF